VQIKFIITIHDFGPDYTLHKPKLHGSPQVNIHCIEIFFHRSQFLSNLRLPWKTRVVFKIFTVLIYFLHWGFWTTCACPENRVSPAIFPCIEYIFYHSGFLNNLHSSWKTDLPRNFHCIEYTFYIQNFWATCACPEKQRVPWIHSPEYILFIIQDFWATCACPEKQSCPGIFHCNEYLFFVIQDFWATCTCPENRVCPEIFQARRGGSPPRPPASYAYA